MGGPRYFLGIWLGIVILTGCAPKSKLDLYGWVTFFDFLVWLFLLSMPILVIIKLSSGGYATQQKKQTLISAWAGIFAGFAVFIIYMAWFPNKVLPDGTNLAQDALSMTPNPTTPIPETPSLEFILFTLLGVGIGFVALFVLRKLLSSWRLVGFFNLSVVAMVLIITVHFMGVDEGPAIPALIPGIGLGVLAHIVCVPDTLIKFFE